MMKISKRKLKSGKTSYAVRWVCPVEETWKTRTVGTDYRAALGELAKLRERLTDGSYRPSVTTTWDTFTKEVTGYRTGAHAAQVRATLRQFGKRFSLRAPRQVTPKMIRAYVLWLEERGCKPASVNNRLRNLRLAFRQAVDDHYVAECPVKPVHFRREVRRDADEIRILQSEELPKLLKAADDLYALPMRMLIEFSLETWARPGEVAKLAWDDVHFDKREPGVHFRSTKSHEDRHVPIENTGLMGKLLRLKAQTQEDGGPFRRYADRSKRAAEWRAVVAKAGIDPIDLYDLRRTGISRALLDGMTPVAVCKLAGHASITTTERYYLGVSKRDLRDAVKARKSESAS